MNERIPHYKVRMGYGLHFGWAIEGAIGSPKKVDASYLSPHVNVAARLEGATKEYGINIFSKKIRSAIFVIGRNLRSIQSRTKKFC